MKKVFVILSLIVMIILTTAVYVNAYTKTYTLSLEVKENNKNENMDIYILLPEKYIEYAIKNDNLDIAYEGVDTLKNNYIPGIQVEKENIEDEIYEDDETKYIQILLPKNSNGTYEFDIISEYEEMDMKFRIKNTEKDYIMHIDNFKVENEVCKIEYNYSKNEIKQPDKMIIPLATKILIAILIIIVIIGGISYIKQRR